MAFGIESAMLDRDGDDVSHRIVPDDTALSALSVVHPPLRADQIALWCVECLAICVLNKSDWICSF